MASEAALKRIMSEEAGKLLTAALQHHRSAPPGTPAPTAPYYAGDKLHPHSPKQAQLQLEQLIAAKQFNTAFKQVG